MDVVLIWGGGARADATASIRNAKGVAPFNTETALVYSENLRCRGHSPLNRHFADLAPSPGADVSSKTNKATGDAVTLLVQSIFGASVRCHHHSAAAG